MDLKVGDLVPERFKEWFDADLRHTEQWRNEAKIDFDFRDGHQWSETEEKILEDRNQPPTVFNRILTIVDAVAGQEISNRKEVRYIPRVQASEDDGQDEKTTELYTEAARYFRDEADADDNDTEAFRDTLTGGMGWTETRLDFEEDPQGTLRVDRVNPFEMVWDYNATKRNLLDANRVWHLRSIPIDEARAMFPDIEDDTLDADWAAKAIWYGDDAHVAEKVRDRTRRNMEGSGADLDEAVVVHVQWIERETVWHVPIPGAEPGQRKQFSEKDYARFKKEFAARIGGGVEPTDQELGAVKQKKKVRYRAFLGKTVLKVTPTACPDHFNFQCITGKRDQTKNQWFGLVRPMRDPQSWSNKFFSQILHIINSNAKGGIFAERGTAFDNDADAEESYAKTDRITWVKAGALNAANPKFGPKPTMQFPQGLQYLMEYAAASTRETGGVSLELLGQKDTQQAGVLEYQRKQAGLTILAPLFDNLKAYRRENGEIILYYIQNHLSDGRLIRIVGPRKAQYVPLLQGQTLDYDIIVDDMPSSPNQKEMTWQIVTQMLPVIKDVLTPDVFLTLLKASPLPSQVVDDMQKGQEEQAKGDMAQLQQRMAMLEAALNEAKVGQVQADTQLKQAQAAKTAAEAQQGGPDPMAEQQKTASEIALKAGKMQSEQQLAREQATEKAQLARESQTADMILKQQAQEAEIARANRKTDAEIANRAKIAKAQASRKPVAAQ